MSKLGARRATLSVPRLSAEVLQFYDRLATIPNDNDDALYRTLIDGLVADNLWSTFDQLVIPAAADFGTGFTDLVSGTFAPYVNNPIQGTYVANVGFTPSGSVSYIQTGFTPSNGVNFTQNSASLFVWNLDSTAQNQALLRSIPDLGTELWPRYSGNTLYQVNTTATENSAANGGDASGFYVATRTASNATAVYRNAAQLGTASTASASRETNMITGGYGVTVAWKFACFGFASGWTSAQVTQVDSRIRAFLRGKGNAV